MNVSREKVAATLFAQLQTVVGTGPKQYPFQTFSRAPMIWTNVASADMPSAFLFKPTEQTSSEDVSGAKKYFLHYTLRVYLQGAPSRDELIETIQNQILDALDNALGDEQ